jgi:hypothetical protein
MNYGTIARSLARRHKQTTFASAESMVSPSRVPASDVLARQAYDSRWKTDINTVIAQAQRANAALRAQGFNTDKIGFCRHGKIVHVQCTLCSVPV